MLKAMKCPVCKTVVLRELELEPGLWGVTCDGCSGYFVAGSVYWTWLDRRDGSPSPVGGDAVVGEVRDVLKAKLCPDCGKILRRCRVGHGQSFTIDHCGGCEGVWFDANEWPTLRGAGLHTQVHLIVSPKWQAQVAEEDRLALQEQRLLARLGAEDLAEIKRIKAWIDGHPKRSELYAFVLSGTEGNVVSYNPGDRPAHGTTNGPANGGGVASDQGAGPG